MLKMVKVTGEYFTAVRVLCRALQPYCRLVEAELFAARCARVAVGAELSLQIHGDDHAAPADDHARRWPRPTSRPTPSTAAQGTSLRAMCHRRAAQAPRTSMTTSSRRAAGRRSRISRWRRRPRRRNSPTTCTQRGVGHHAARCSSPADRDRVQAILRSSKGWEEEHPGIPGKSKDDPVVVEEYE